MIVVDASLAVKWVLAEPDSPAALRFLAARAPELTAPDLLFVEVGSALVRKANIDVSLRETMRGQLEEWSVAWRNHFVRAARTDPVAILRAGHIAMDLGHPLKDCVYLALAIELGCDLATCDVKFAAKALAVWPGVRLLESYP